MRRMFPRQLLLTVCLILLTLLLVSASFQVMLYRYVLDVAQQRLTDTAEAAADMMELLGTAPPDLLSRFQLNYTARSTGNDALLCDPRGTVLACSCGMQSCTHLGRCLNPELLLSADAKAASPDTPVSELYGEERMYAVAPVTDVFGTVRWYIIASTGYDSSKTILKNAIRINLRTVLIVLPVAVLAVWWLVRRQTKPIKQLTQAATLLRHGQLSARVPTGGGNTAETEELAIAFNNMAQALEQSDRRRQEFVANVSHELKTPMTTISGYMDGMLDGTIPQEQHPKYMQLISSEVKRLSRLVRNMLDISRLQEQTVPRERMRRFDLCETVGQALIGFEQKINGKQLEVNVQLPPEGAAVLADPDAIGQVVYNLIDNAVKFCPEAGLLGITLAPTGGGKYLLTVTNDGPTIPPEELPLIFDRFHKADKSRSEDREGWGLGLYIVHSILRSHGEDIFVTSRDGKTAFSFTLQRAEM